MDSKLSNIKTIDLSNLNDIENDIYDHYDISLNEVKLILST